MIEEREGTPLYLPTEAEIVAACERIREGWGAAERQRRLAGEPNERPRVETQLIRISEIETINRKH